MFQVYYHSENKVYTDEVFITYKEAVDYVLFTSEELNADKIVPSFYFSIEQISNP